MRAMRTADMLFISTCCNDEADAIHKFSRSPQRLPNQLSLY